MRARVESGEMATDDDRPPPTLVVVAFEDEALAWTSGLFVRRRLDRPVDIVVRTDADGGLETSDDESDETPRRDAGTIREKNHKPAFTFAEDVNDDEEGGMRSYRALVSGRG